MVRARLCRNHRDQLRSRIFGQASGIDVAVDRDHHSITSAVLARFDSISNRLVVKRVAGKSSTESQCVADDTRARRAI